MALQRPFQMHFHTPIEINSQILRKEPYVTINKEEFYCYGTNLFFLPTLHEGLVKLYCYNNRLLHLPNLPKSLKVINCYNNLLYDLPDLHEGLEFLMCCDNRFKYLPKIPKSLNFINISVELFGKEYRIHDVKKYRDIYNNYRMILTILVKFDIPDDVKRLMIKEYFLKN